MSEDITQNNDCADSTRSNVCSLIASVTGHDNNLDHILRQNNNCYSNSLGANQAPIESTVGTCENVRLSFWQLRLLNEDPPVSVRFFPTVDIVELADWVPLFTAPESLMKVDTDHFIHFA